jgi:hypothetical protein
VTALTRAGIPLSLEATTLAQSFDLSLDQVKPGPVPVLEDDPGLFRVALGGGGGRLRTSQTHAAQGF